MNITPIWSDRNVPRNFGEWFAVNGDATLALDFPLNPDSTIVVIGAHKGEYCDLAHRKFGCEIHAYEPVPAFYEGLAGRVLPGVKTYNEGVSADPGQRVLYVDGVSTSLHSPNSRGIEANFVGIETVLERIPNGKADMLFVNIEGEEYPLMNDILDKGLIDRFTYLQIQFHLFADKTNERRNGIVEKLSKSHEKMWDFPYVWESWVLKNKNRGNI